MSPVLQNYQKHSTINSQTGFNLCAYKKWSSTWPRFQPVQTQSCNLPILNSPYVFSKWLINIHHPQTTLEFRISPWKGPVEFWHEKNRTNVNDWQTSAMLSKSFNIWTDVEVRLDTFAFQKVCWAMHWPLGSFAQQRFGRIVAWYHITSYNLSVFRVVFLQYDSVWKTSVTTSATQQIPPSSRAPSTNSSKLTLPLPSASMPQMVEATNRYACCWQVKLLWWHQECSKDFSNNRIPAGEFCHAHAAAGDFSIHADHAEGQGAFEHSLQNFLVVGQVNLSSGTWLRRIISAILASSNIFSNFIELILCCATQAGSPYCYTWFML